MSAVTSKTVQLNHYLTEVPEKIASQMKRKALALNVIEKISWVALIAILGVALGLYYTGTVLTGNVSLLVAGAIISTPFLIYGAIQLRLRSDAAASRAKSEDAVALELKKIAHWKTAQIQQFFTDQGLNLAEVPIDALKQLNRDEPLCALLPLIARFNHLKNTAESIEREAKATPLEIEEGFKKQEAATKTIMDETTKRNIRYEAREVAWWQHEFRAIPTALTAAIILRNIQKPTETLELSKIGVITPKTFSQRMSDLNHAPIDDNYLTPASPNYPALTHAAIQKNQEPKTLYRQIFLNPEHGAT